MGEGTNIQWADDTHNFWRICTKVSPGCKNCYAETLLKNRRGEKWGKGAPRIRLQDFYAPTRWNNKPWVCDGCGWKYKSVASRCEVTQCKIYVPHFHGERHCNSTSFHRRRVFSLSLGDWLDEEAPIEWLADMLNVIRQCPDLDFLLLTKRPENWEIRTGLLMEATDSGNKALREYLHSWRHGCPPHNVWLGVSVEDQQRADERLPELLKIPARVRFLSVEPMLEAINTLWKDGIDWTIFGFESGPNARPGNVQWIREGVAQCRAAGAAPFVKQLGKYVLSDSFESWPEGTECRCAGVILKDKKGGDFAEWPEDLRVREFPTSLTHTKHDPLARTS